MRPFLSIWTKPKETYTCLAERSLTGKENNLNYLFALIALSIYLPKFNEIPKLFVGYELYGFVVTAVFVTVLGLLVYKYIMSFLVWKIGKMLSGSATFAEIQLVLAYSLIPTLIHLVIVLIFIIPAIQTGNVNMIFNQNPITFLVISLFTLRNLIFGLSYFNHFSYGFAVLNILIVGLIFEAISLMIKH